MSQDIVVRLQERFPDLRRRESLDWPALNCPAEKWAERAAALKDWLTS